MSRYAWGDLLASLPWTLAAVAAAQAATLLFALRLRRHGVVDITWGAGFVLIAFVSFALSAGVGDDLRRWLLLAMTTLWGGRLALHIAARSGGREDPRYEALMRRAGDRNGVLFAVTRIYLPQGALMWLVSLPIQVAVFSRSPVGWFAWLVWVGVAVWAVGLFFEAVGDVQLTRFRADASSTGKVLDTGLWRYTRHPNYFGDACVWWGLYVVSASAWPGVLTVFSPLVMTYLLTKGSGKPLLERGMASTRPGYEEYVRRTSGFVPLPPKRPARHATQEA